MLRYFYLVKKTIFNFVFTASMILFILSLIGCFKEVEFNNIDDPQSDNYVNASGDTLGCASIRQGLTSAIIRWKWNKADSIVNATGVIIERYQLDTSTVFNLTFEEIDTVVDSDCWEWVDTQLKLETDYQYKIWLSNEGGQAKDSVVVNYYHGFFPITNIQIYQVQSDTSILCKWQVVESQINDTLANLMRFKWQSGDGSILLDTLTIPPDSIELINTGVELGDTTSVNIWYGYASEGDTVWQNDTAPASYTMVFDPVTDLYVVPFQSEGNRITWRYDSTHVKPDWFIIQRNDSSKDSVLNSSSGVTQIILEEPYFVYYDTVFQNLEYQVIPETHWHSGDTSHISLDGTIEVDSGLIYVDSMYHYFSEGFYISLYEITLHEFMETYNTTEGFDSSYFYENSAGDATGLRWEGNGLVLVNVGTERLPVDSINWILADTMATLMGGRLPTEAGWELAARAASYFPEDINGRDYPWGNDPPNPTICNYGNSDTLISVDSLEGGRVRIFPFQSVKGPYHMSGNVREWTESTTIARGVVSKITKGGNRRDSTSLVRIDSFRPFSESDPIAGFRIVKSVEEMRNE